jgi:hypothetical protein
MINLTSPVTGLAQTGLTSPTYTVTADKAPDVNGTQYAVTALGGTQSGVSTHTGSSPFTITFWKPKFFAVLGMIGVNGQYSKVPTNKHKLLVRKGVSVAAGQPPRIMSVLVEIEVPAGAETYDSANVRAALSAAFGSCSQMSAGIGDTVVTNVA